MFLIICSADPLENHLKYKYLLLLVVLSDAKIGLTHGKDLALGELGEETTLFYVIFHLHAGKTEILMKRSNIVRKQARRR